MSLLAKNLRINNLIEKFYNYNMLYFYTMFPFISVLMTSLKEIKKINIIPIVLKSKLR